MVLRFFELTQKQRTFSWIKIEDVWVSTFTPILIEDVIRMHNSRWHDLQRKIRQCVSIAKSKK
jgi:hypothetical protein